MVARGRSLRSAAARPALRSRRTAGWRLAVVAAARGCAPDEVGGGAGPGERPRGARPELGGSRCVWPRRAAGVAGQGRLAGPRRSDCGSPRPVSLSRRAGGGEQCFSPLPFLGARPGPGSATFPAAAERTGCGEAAARHATGPAQHSPGIRRPRGPPGAAACGNCV